jgi:hypothetical protein
VGGRGVEEDEEEEEENEAGPDRSSDAVRRQDGALSEGG